MSPEPLQLPRCPGTVRLAGEPPPGEGGCAAGSRNSGRRHRNQRMRLLASGYHPLELEQEPEVRRHSESAEASSKMNKLAIAAIRAQSLVFLASSLLGLSLVVALTESSQSFQLIKPLRSHHNRLNEEPQGAGAPLPVEVPQELDKAPTGQPSGSGSSSAAPPPAVCTSILGIDDRVISELASTGTTTTRTRNNEPLSFRVRDIDIPVARGDAPVNSAIRLLSAISDQLEETGESDNTLRFRDSQVTITRMNLSMLSIHLHKDEEPKFSIGMSFFNSSMSGRFAYNGPVVLNSHYRMFIDNILLTSSSNLSNFEGVLRTNEFSLNVTSLGYMTVEFFDDANHTEPTRNYALKMLQKFIQKTIKRTYASFESQIRPGLEQALRQLIDCELYHLSPPNMAVSDRNYQHQLSVVANKWIRKLKFDVFELPDFHHEQSLLGMLARVKFSNGSLSGLNHVYFSGDSRLKLQGEHLLLNSSLGWTDLRAHYNWNLTMGNNSRSAITKGFVAFDITRVEFGAVITKGLRHQARFVVERLGIERLDGPKMDISGLPGMNRLTRVVVNFFMNRLKERLVSSIQATLKKQLERTLNKLPLLGA